jgi:hypothetical protein
VILRNKCNYAQQDQLSPEKMVDVCLMLASEFSEIQSRKKQLWKLLLENHHFHFAPRVWFSFSFQRLSSDFPTNFCVHLQKDLIGSLCNVFSVIDCVHVMWLIQTLRNYLCSGKLAPFLQTLDDADVIDDSFLILFEKNGHHHRESFFLSKFDLISLSIVANSYDQCLLMTFWCGCGVGGLEKSFSRVG